MAAVIPQLTINPCALNDARKKLQSRQTGNSVCLTAAEREAVLALIQRGKRHLYPDAAALERYQYHLDMLGSIDRLKEPAQFDHFATKIEAFEQKYCT